MSTKTYTSLMVVSFLNLLLPLQSFAGWTSSGGETLKDKINPWFLQNTTEVRYCILVDQANFGQSFADVQRRVQKTLQIWKHQLGNLKMRSVGGSSSDENLPRLGTQNFIEVNCNLNGPRISTNGADLVFQFGVLSGEQLSKIGDPTSYIGLTVRTEYDPVNLRGKGFMYFSPENGPLKLNKSGLVQNPWSRQNGQMLLVALLHELGHVFGIQHTDHFPLMEESYLEFVLTNFGQDDDEQTSNPIDLKDGDVYLLFNFFKFDMPDNFPFDTYCRSSSRSSEGSIQPPVESGPATKVKSLKTKARKPLSPFLIPITDSIWDRFFGTPGVIDAPSEARSECYGIKRKGHQFLFEVTETKENGVRVIIGQALNLERLDSSLDERNIVSLWLPREQKIFEFGDYAKYFLERKHGIGSMQILTLFKGNYVIKKTGVSRPFFVEANNFGRSRFGGEMDGVYYHDLGEGF
jgi:hypothetical protein